MCKDLRPIGLPMCAYCLKHGKKDIYHRPENCPRIKALKVKAKKEK